MDSRENPFRVERVNEEKEGEPRSEVPIINAIRHGQTKYKELQDPDFKFNPEAPDFKLDAEHLDLTDEGIENIRETAQQLVDSIDKNNEVVILTTSPNFRAHSSILLIEKVLLDQGITVLNSTQTKTEGKSEGIKKTQALEQIEFKDPDYRSNWIQADQKYRKEEPDNINKHTETAHQEIAARLDKKIPDIFVRDHAQIDKRFQRWLRHMSNIDKYFQEDTKKLIGGRKIRLVSVTHEELLDKFSQQALGTTGNIRKGQMLEIQPQDMIEPQSSTQAKLKLYQKGSSMTQEGNVTIHYNPDKTPEEQKQ